MKDSIQFNSCHTCLPCLEWSELSQRHGFLVAAGHPNLHLEKLLTVNGAESRFRSRDCYNSYQLVTGLQINVALWKTSDFKAKRYLQSKTMWTTKEQESKWNLEKIHKKNHTQHHSTSRNTTWPIKGGLVGQGSEGSGGLGVQSVVTLWHPAVLSMPLVATPDQNPIVQKKNWKLLIL